MKKLFIVFSFFFCAGWIKAQKTNSIAINGYAAYVFQDRIKFDEFIGYAREGFQYGIGLEYFLQSSRSIEFKYLRQDSRFPLYGPQGNQLNEGNDEGTISYFLLSGSNYFGTSQSKAMPYAGFGLGVGIVDSKGGGSSTKFALDSKLGIRIKNLLECFAKTSGYAPIGYCSHWI